MTSRSVLALVSSSSGFAQVDGQAVLDGTQPSLMVALPGHTIGGGTPVAPDASVAGPLITDRTKELQPQAWSLRTPEASGATG